ncbi:helix-turn-helix domain-containing protein [Streptomyces sp. NPDC020883]|uniref:helix-turn-helix domain-containing protein n=1 Tax=Streptomyces sp. NPDC020883 TaxID=3365099 RepID=UPI003788C579
MDTPGKGRRDSDGAEETVAFWVPSIADTEMREAFVRESLVDEIVLARPHPLLRSCVLGYAGGRGSNTPLSALQRVPPETAVMVAISFRTAARRLVTPAGTQLALPTVAVVGLHDRLQMIQQPGGPQEGLMIALTPPGAYSLLGVPMHELANTSTHLTDLAGQRILHLVEQLIDAPSWSTRFKLLDHQLLSWLQAGRRADAAVVEGWRRLHGSHGTLPVGELAAGLGCSRRYLEKKFREQVGLSPKTAARVLRFQRAAYLLTRTELPSCCAIAHRCGYADHSHLDRDFRDLAGCTPTQLRRSLPMTLERQAPRGVAAAGPLDLRWGERE